jgi:hypothetical protein
MRESGGKRERNSEAKENSKNEISLAPSRHIWNLVTGRIPLLPKDTALATYCERIKRKDERSNTYFITILATLWKEQIVELSMGRRSLLMCCFRG